MKLFSKILLGGMLLTSGSAMAQGKSGMHGNNKTVTVKTQSSNGSINANEHASESGQMHASDKSILNRSTTVVRTRTYGGRKYYHKNGKRYSHKHFATKRYVKKDD